MPFAAGAQVNPDAGKATDQGETISKYEVYAGAAYTRIRQVPSSYSGLVGGKMSLTRDWGKHFQLGGAIDYYKLGTGHAGIPSPGAPWVYTALAAPGFHVDLFGGLSGQIFAELGAEHTGGESMSPSTSVAGGVGGGLAYRLKRNLALQLTGDRIGASFPEPDQSGSLGYSTHRTWNARVTMGLVYRF